MKAPLICADCGHALNSIDYQIWGTKRFSAESGEYEEDESPGNTDMQFSCPHCSAKLDPEAILGF